MAPTVPDVPSAGWKPEDTQPLVCGHGWSPRGQAAPTQVGAVWPMRAFPHGLDATCSRNCGNFPVLASFVPVLWSKCSMPETHPRSI